MFNAPMKRLGCLSSPITDEAAGFVQVRFAFLLAALLSVASKLSIVQTPVRWVTPV